MAGPVDTFKALIRLIQTAAFRKSILSTSLRIAKGFALGSIVGFLLAVLSYRIKLLEEFFSPFVTVVKAVPVVSFIIIVMVWSGPDVATVISAVVVFPVLFINTLNGLKSTDIKMLEMAGLYKVPFLRTLKYIYIPTIKPFLISAFSLAIGMAWKSGIAAELIDQTQSSLGNSLYISKINLATADLLAWTLVAVVLSFICEKALLFLLKKIPGGTSTKEVK